MNDKGKQVALMYVGSENERYLEYFGESDRFYIWFARIRDEGNSIEIYINKKTNEIENVGPWGNPPSAYLNDIKQAYEDKRNRERMDYFI